MDNFQKMLEEIEALRGWGGYDPGHTIDPISDYAVSKALSVANKLPEPFEVFATGRSSLQLEWSNKSNGPDYSYMEIEVYEDRFGILLQYEDKSYLEEDSIQEDAVIALANYFVATNKVK